MLPATVPVLLYVALLITATACHADNVVDSTTQGTQAFDNPTDGPRSSQDIINSFPIWNNHAMLDRFDDMFKILKQGKEIDDYLKLVPQSPQVTIDQLENMNMK